MILIFVKLCLISKKMLASLRWLAFQCKTYPDCNLGKKITTKHEILSCQKMMTKSRTAD